MRAKRTGLGTKEAEELSRRACAHILASECWQQARMVALYMAVRGETDTIPLLEDAWQHGKAVLLPLCSRENEGEMRFAVCAGPDNLCMGPYSIPEPLCEDGPQINASALVPDLMIVPGLAFDTAGNRLGMGGGYYDRLLALPCYARGIRIGLAYAFQVVQALPSRKWDKPVHAVCTEKGIVWIHATCAPHPPRTP